jgi:hypothetical protein
MSSTNLITCRTHGLNPGGVLCKHLANKTADTAVRIPPPQGEEGADYLCAQCAVHPWDLQPDNGDLVAACMHCSRECVKGMAVYELDEFSRLNQEE